MVLILLLDLALFLILDHDLILDWVQHLDVV